MSNECNLDYNEIFTKQLFQTLGQLVAGLLSSSLAIPVYSFYTRGYIFYNNNNNNNNNVSQFNEPSDNEEDNTVSDNEASDNEADNEASDNEGEEREIIVDRLLIK